MEAENNHFEFVNQLDHLRENAAGTSETPATKQMIRYVSPVRKGERLLIINWTFEN